MLHLDHLVVTCPDLDEGAAAVEAALGVRLGPGGAHPAMGTHNRLLALGPGLYLEVIAPDPDAVPPPRARWFALDEVAGPPRLMNWVARTDDLDAALAAAPAGTGAPVSLSRGALAWRMAVPADGRLPFGGFYPALIEWETGHPAEVLPDAGCRLERLELRHPEAAALRAALSGLAEGPEVAVVADAAPALRARIATPEGPRWLQ